MAEQVLAVDIGGTKVAVAVIDATGEIVVEGRAPTLASTDAEEVLAPVAALVEKIAGDHAWPGPVRIGIGSAGPIDAPGGTISPVNIGAWREFPICERLADVVSRATGTEAEARLAGDGHCFALGEHWMGAGRDWRSMVGLVVSTGVGGGAVIDNQLLSGLTGNAVHLGHISVNAWGEACVCGCHGCVEMYARGPAMVAEARRRGWRGGDDALALTQAARSGDPVAVEVIEVGMRALAAGIASTATNLDVACFVIGGGVAKAGEVLFEPLRRHLADFAVLPYVSQLQVRPAELDNAGILGAAALALGDVRFGEPDQT